MQKAISKTHIKKDVKKKTSPLSIETIMAAKKHKAWLYVAKCLASPTRQYPSFNLHEIDAGSEDGDTVVIPGKVLGDGKVSKKIKIVAFSFSASALDKMKEAKVEGAYIIDEIKKNPEAKGVKLLR